MSHRTHRPVPKRRRARRPLVQGFGQTVFYAASATLASGLVHELFYLVHMAAFSG
ncbi:hypothetical protein ACIQPR_10050 [Streptomyces sp. NPDC091280]|uniref:hypothetical protein n=1 Tax=Streptomyces sp. NPDC091280 TaxID=3365984 RepID=UPI00380B55A9